MSIMTLSLPRLITLSPTGLADPGVVVAGCRAGALGVLDFGTCFEVETARAAAGRVARYLDGGGFGLRLPAGALGAVALEGMPAGLGVVVVVEDGGGRDDWPAARAALGQGGRRPIAVAEV